MKAHFFLLLTLFFAQNGLFSQTTVVGKLRDERHEPLPFCTVLLMKAADSSLVKGATSDIDGTFLFEEIENGRFFVRASCIGFGQLQTPVFETKGQPIEVPDLNFASIAGSLAEVKVVAKRPFIEVQADKLIVNVDAHATSAGATALEILRKAPGVRVSHENEISLKGKNEVLIMIDGKQTFLSQDELTKMLAAMPADGIDRIEIIQNPSAKYEASGNAGIINLRLKKDKNLGFNGNAKIGAGKGINWRETASLNLNYRTKKFNAFGNYSFNQRGNTQRTTFSRSVMTDGKETIFNEAFTNFNGGPTHSPKAGIDFFLSEKTTLGLLFSTNFYENESTLDNKISLAGSNPYNYERISAFTTGDSKTDRQVYNVNLKHVFDSVGREMNLDFDYSSWNLADHNLLDNSYFDAENNQPQMPFRLRSGAASGVDVLAGKVDFTLPIRKGLSFETGLKSSSVKITNSILYETQDSTRSWLRDNGRSNDFNFDEKIHAGYVNLNRAFNEKWQLQAGLRAEWTINKGISVTENEENKQNYLNFFPSASLSFQPSEKHGLSLAYSRRIDRPSYEDLNPFQEYIDEFTFEKGNPGLQPQFSNSLSLTHTFMGAVSTSVSYSRTNDAFSQILDQNPATRVVFISNQNLDRFDNYSLSIGSPIPIKKWWEAYFNLTGYYSRYQTVYEGNQFDNYRAAISAYAETSFKLEKGWNLEASGDYNSPGVWGIFRFSHMGTVNFGASKTVLDGKGKFSLAVDDPFNLGKNHVMINVNGINVDLRDKWESRRVHLSFSYKFGNSQVKSARRRTTATEEELKRVKN